MRTAFALLLATLAAGCSTAPDGPVTRPKAVLLIRHAEKPADANDTGLSPAGRQRAETLHELFTKSEARPDPLPTPDIIIATRASKRSNRPADTVTPLAGRLKLEVRCDYVNDDYVKQAAALLADPRYAGKTVLVSWHHGTLPEFAASLGATGVPAKWGDDVYDRVWVVTFDDAGPAKPLTQLRQTLMPGDAKN